MKQSSWLILIIIILVIIGGFVWWHSTQTSSTGTPVTSTSTPVTGDTATYTNTALGFSVQYPSSAVPSQSDYNGFLPATQTALTSIVLPAALSAGTNLSNAGVYIGATTSPKMVASCTSTASSTGEIAQGTQTLNGQQFAVFSASDAGAGNFYESKSYRTVKNGSCIEIIELIHSTNIANYPEGTVTAFNHDQFSALLDAIVHTYQTL